jgi:hypothetical protein
MPNQKGNKMNYDVTLRVRVTESGSPFNAFSRALDRIRKGTTNLRIWADEYPTIARAVEEVSGDAAFPIREEERPLTESKLTQLLKDAAAAHHVFEQGLGKADPNWPEWYAAYITSESFRQTLNGKESK